jgi:hypothetical protein
MFAQAPPTPKQQQALFQSAEFYLALGVLAAVLLVGAVVIHFVDRWRRRQAEGATAGRETTLDLTSYRELYENGEITQSEYERIRDKLAVKMKQEVGLAGPPGGSAQPAPPAPPPPPDEPPRPDGPPPPPAPG